MVTATSVFNPLVSFSANVTVPAITVALTPHSALIPTSVNQQFTATVSNDPANKGVTWALTQGTTTCSPACGIVAPSSTSSGAPTTYTAPASVPANPTVTLTTTSASDSTKSEAATITVSSGTVKLVPVELQFGIRPVGISSAAQTTTLTNTGSSALTINGVNVTGTNPGDFSLVQANPCGTSVAVGSTCSIGVTFKPTATGGRSASLSISDSSTDSPQKVSLLGTGRRLCGAQIKQTLSGVMVRSALATVGTAMAPVPTGPNSVGTREMRLVDTSREDPFLENGTKRELMVRFWYPASLNQDCKPAEYTPPAVWSYFSQLMGLPLPAVTTNSCQDAHVADGAYPIVVFTHGYTGTFTDYTFIFEDLASRGYVVASVDHTYEATAVQFPDGRFVHSGFGSHLGKTVLEDDPSLSFALSVRLDDLKFVANELNRLNRTAQSPFTSRLDTSRIAVAGHSMGGLAAALVVQGDLRFKAGVIIDVHDGNVPEAVVGSTQTPVFILDSGREQWTENECKLWNNLHGPRFAVNFEGAEHLTPSDAVWLAKYAVKTGTMGPDKTVTAFRNYIAAFLDATLKENALDAILTGPSADYPDAAVVPPEQPLCSKGTNHAVTLHPTETH
jgi:dienelactone hydrolase